MKKAFSKDGSCFFRCISYFFQKEQEKRRIYRRQLYNLIKYNYGNIKDNYAYEIKNNKKIYYIDEDLSNNSKTPHLE